MSPVDAKNDTGKICMAWFCKDDSAQNNSCDTAQIVARRSYSRKGSCVLVLPESVGKTISHINTQWIRSKKQTNSSSASETGFSRCLLFMSVKLEICLKAFDFVACVVILIL